MILLALMNVKQLAVALSLHRFFQSEPHGLQWIPGSHLGEGLSLFLHLLQGTSMQGLEIILHQGTSLAHHHLYSQMGRYAQKWRNPIKGIILVTPLCMILLALINAKQLTVALTLHHFFHSEPHGLQWIPGSHLGEGLRLFLHLLQGISMEGLEIILHQGTSLAHHHLYSQGEMCSHHHHQGAFHFTFPQELGSSPYPLFLKVGVSSRQT
ncbi:hypothetical protein LEMLEM_LOCUS4016 [Lemmus lemmus]